MPTIFDKLLPTLAQLGREKRAKREKEKRTQRTIDIAQQLIRGDVSGETRAALYAEATQLGLNLPSAYAFDLIDEKDLPPEWPPELVRLYRGRGASYIQTDTMYKRATGDKGLTIEKATVEWNQSVELQKFFPGTKDAIGPQRFLNYVNAEKWVGATVANRMYGTSVPTKDDRDQEVLKRTFGTMSAKEFLSNPLAQAQADLAGISPDAQLQYFGYDIGLAGKARNNVLDRIMDSDRLLKTNLPGYVAQWMAGELSDKNQARFGSILEQNYNPDTGELKLSVQVKELKAIQAVALAGLTGAGKNIPEHLQSIVAFMVEEKLTKGEVEEYLKEGIAGTTDPHGRYTGLKNTNWSIEDIREAAEYLE